MKKKFSVLAGIILCAAVITFYIIGVIQNSIRKPDEDTLIFEGDNQSEVWIDMVIQGKEGIIYLGSMLLKDSQPTMQNVVDTINNSDEEILIDIDHSGMIFSVNGCQNEEMRHWNLYINNKGIPPDSIKDIRVNDYDGITLRFE